MTSGTRRVSNTPQARRQPAGHARSALLIIIIIIIIIVIIIIIIIIIIKPAGSPRVVLVRARSARGLMAACIDQYLTSI